MAKFKVGDTVQSKNGDNLVYEVVYVNDKPTKTYSTQQYCVRNLENNALLVVGESLMKIAQKIWYIVDTETKEIIFTAPYHIRIGKDKNDCLIRIIDTNISDGCGQIVQWWHKDQHPNIEIREVVLEV